jgi:hypothetical protein
MVILRQEVFQAIQEQAKIQEKLADAPASEAFDQLRKLLTAEDEPEPDKPV